MVGGIAAGGTGALVRGGGERWVVRWWACDLSRCFGQVLSAPRGQFKQRGDADRNRRRGPRTTCRLRWSLLGTSRSANDAGTKAR